MHEFASEDWKRLTTTIARGKLIAFVGQDAVVSCTANAGRSLWGELTRNILSDLDSSDVTWERDYDFFAAAEKHDVIREDRFELEETVSEFFQQFRSNDIMSLVALAKLPIPLYIYTGTDQLLFEAVKEVRSTAQFGTYNHLREEESSISEASVTSPVVYNIFGSINNDTSSAVLTEKDLLDFISAILRQSPPLPSYLSRLLTDPETSFLFLGVRFHQWYGRIMLQIVRDTTRKYKSIALERADFFKHPDQPAVAFFCQKSQKIVFKHVDLLNVLSELTRKVSVACKEPPQSFPAKAPTIFISYASEDRDFVDELTTKLGQAGIRSWLDKQELRAGDNWQRQLRRVIDNHVNYFLFLYSKNMAIGGEGVYWLESRVALSRQEKKSPGRRFYIPVSIDETPLPSDILDEFHVIDISTEAGFDKLVLDILSDWETENEQNETT